MPGRTESGRKSRRENPEKNMTLSGHLKEMRNRLIVCLVVLFLTMLLGIRLAPDLVQLLLDIGEQYSYHFVYLAPQEMLMQYFSVAFIMAVCLSMPVILYEIWAFVSPGLRKNENLFFVLALVFGLICFCGGVYFAYRVMLPFMLYFLITLSSGTGVESAVSVQNYISFLMTIFVIFGVVFELPVLSVLLTQMNLLKVEWMKKGRKFVIVLIFFIAAVITPPDVLSQVMVAVPMIILYQVSIILCTFFKKLRKP